MGKVDSPNSYLAGKRIRGAVFRWVACGFTVAWLAASLPVQAAPKDLTLWRMCQRNPDTTASNLCLLEPGQVVGEETRALADKTKWRKFAQQFSMLFAPKYHSAADTLGMSGFNLGFDYTMTSVSKGDHWNDALEGVERFADLDPYGDKAREADNLLSTFQFAIRKGLPYSFDIGFDATYFLHSKLFYFGMNVKYAFLEDFHDYAPDVALRLNYGQLFGSTDLDMRQFGWDLVISKSFPAAGVVEVTPYTGYAFLVSFLRPGILNPSFDAYLEDALLKLPDRDEIIHRWYAGLKLIVATFHLAPEIQVSSVEAYAISFNLGAEF